MSSEIQRAEADVRKATERFDAALGELSEKIEQGLKSLGHPIDRLVESARDYATGLVRDIQKSADQALDNVEKNRLAAWGAVFLSGCLLGALLALRAPATPAERP